MPARFKLTYTGKDGQEHPVVTIHRAPLGSHERFIAFLIEHYAGAFPLWLAPVQVAVLPVSDKFSKYAENVAAQLSQANIRVETDMRAESIGKKIRDAELQKIPYMLIVGEKEKQSQTVNVRKRGEKKQTALPLVKLLGQLKTKIQQKLKN